MIIGIKSINSIKPLNLSLNYNKLEQEYYTTTHDFIHLKLLEGQKYQINN